MSRSVPFGRSTASAIGIRKQTASGEDSRERGSNALCRGARGDPCTEPATEPGSQRTTHRTTARC